MRMCPTHTTGTGIEAPGTVTTQVSGAPCISAPATLSLQHSAASSLSSNPAARRASRLNGPRSRGAP